MMHTHPTHSSDPHTDASWFTLHDGGQRVEFLRSASGMRWSPSHTLSDIHDLRGYDWPDEVTLTGPGAVWMYATWGAFLTSCHVPSITVETRVGHKAATIPVPIRPKPHRTQPPWVRFHRTMPGIYSLSFDIKGHIPVQAETSLGLPEMHKASLCITGTGAAWMYTSVVTEAVRRGATLVTCLIPRENGRQAIVVYSQDDPTLCGQFIPHPHDLQDSSPGVILGIVGDPNSGKSVFSNLFDHLQTHTPDLFDHLPALPEHAPPYAGWLFDCDGASPTPHWYLSMVARGLRREGTALRNSHKREWTDQLEDDIADQLQNLREALPLVIADLPGGKHPKPHHTWPAERIPPHREVIMQHIDAFIILSRGDEKIADLWRDDLAKHGLDGRVRAVLISKDPDAPFKADARRDPDSGLWVGSVSGLDRANLPEIKAALDARSDHPLRALLRDIVQNP